MDVKALVRRVPKQGAWQDVIDVIREARALAMNQPGYISGETLLSATGQDATLVISVWATVEDWRKYESSPHRKAILDKLEPLLAQPATMELWVEVPVMGYTEA